MKNIVLECSGLVVMTMALPGCGSDAPSADDGRGESTASMPSGDVEHTVTPKTICNSYVDAPACRLCQTDNMLYKWCDGDGMQWYMCTPGYCGAGCTAEACS